MFCCCFFNKSLLLSTFRQHARSIQVIILFDCPHFAYGNIFTHFTNGKADGQEGKLIAGGHDVEKRQS